MPPRRRLATADGDAASHQAMFAGLRLARTGEPSTKAFGKRFGLVSAHARRFIIVEPCTGAVRHSSSSRTRRTCWLCREKRTKSLILKDPRSPWGATYRLAREKNHLLHSLSFDGHLSRDG